MSEEIVVCPRCGKKYRLRAGAEVEAFPCKECGASVKVKQASMPVKGAGRSASAARPKSKARGRTPARRSAARGRSGAAPAGRAKGRTRPQEEEPQEERRPRSRYGAQRQKNNQVLIMVSGLMLVVVAVAIILSTGGKDEGQKVVKKVNPEQPTSEADLPPDPTVNPNAGAAGGVEEPAGATNAAPSTGEDMAVKPGGVEEPPGNKVNKLGGRQIVRDKRGKKVSRYHAPTELPHLDSTAPGERKAIDEMIAVMVDDEAGGDSSIAREKLVAIGKAAFPRVLAQMARLRDKIPDGQNLDIDAQIACNLLMSSVSQCDRALRAMDFHLSSKGVQEVKIGHTREYVRYISGLHYKRWVTKLSEMDTMPGAYDGSAEYDESEEED